MRCDQSEAGAGAGREAAQDSEEGQQSVDLGPGALQHTCNLLQILSYYCHIIVIRSIVLLWKSAENVYIIEFLAVQTELRIILGEDLTFEADFLVKSFTDEEWRAIIC